MSACESCLDASRERAGVIDSLDQSRISPTRAQQLLERAGAEAQSGFSSAHGRADSRGLLGSIEDLGIWTLCKHDVDFPQGLLHFQRPGDVPLVIYGLGDRDCLLSLENRPSAAIVGARRASAYGREVAYGLGRELSESGLTVVSGMALGIDGAAHRGALQAGGETIAVLAGGVERPYPRSHRLLYEQIIDAGCVISESPPGFEARRWSFVARNRIIAALSAITIFVEGGLTSGARHTVDFAEQLDLPVGAVPGPITSPMSAGPNALLGEVGVITVRAAVDVTEALGLERSVQRNLPLFDRLDQSDELIAAIAAGARDPRALASALPAVELKEIVRRLGELELAGVVRRRGSGEYELCNQPR